MKKTILLLLVMILVVLSGCGSGKKLHCSYENSGEDLKIKAELIYQFDTDGQNLKKMTNIETVTFLTEQAKSENFQEELEGVKESCEQYNNLKGFQCSVKSDEDTIIKTMTITISKVGEEDAKTYGVTSIREYDYDAIKTSISSSKFVCE